MPLLRFPKTFKQSHKIIIGKSLKRVDLAAFFGILDFTGRAAKAAAQLAVLPRH